jgi:dipeptidyl aminopeptidase/acylaminoacyl peptidase
MWGMAILNADGSGRRAVSEAPAGLEEAIWSPNGQLIAYGIDGFRSIMVVDAVTGRTTRVGKADLSIGDIRWLPDSRSIRYVKEDGTQTKMKVGIWEAALDGTERLVRDLTPHLPESGEAFYGATRFLGDSMLFIVRQGFTLPVGDGGPRPLFEKVTGDRTNAVSWNGRWITRGAEDRGSLQIASADGKTSHTLPLPNGLTIDRFSYVQSHPEGFVMLTRATETAPVSMLLAPFDGSPVRPILTLAARERFNDVSMSADGTTIVYNRLGPPTLLFVEVDLAAGLRAGRN